MRELNRFFHNIFDDLSAIWPPKGQGTRDHVVQDYATSPNVYSSAVQPVFTRKHFRGHILESAPVRIRVESICHPTDPEIGHLHSLFILDQNILQLQISMDDSLAVAIMYCTHNLLKVQPSQVLFEFVLDFEEFQEFSAFQVLHNDNDFHIGHGEAVENPDYVGMVEGFKDFGFLEYHIYVGRIRVFVGFQDLDGCKFSRYDIPGQLYTPEPSFA